jgi:hypothetical protein
MLQKGKDGKRVEGKCRMRDKVEEMKIILK